ncbi:hypothetical protein [Exiguobacterium sp. s193]|uniref:hypothetical protein n=1 Tax=Exiguobacterium sp. s193 TaxID=2751207 RepID=UPI001BE9098C|nr:hypothetical protein [Exiguobacterium sp. s193]
MEFSPLKDQADYRTGDWVSLKVTTEGTERIGMITEFEDDGFWLRFEDDFDFEDFIGYDQKYLARLVRRPIDVRATYPALADFEKLAVELQDRMAQGFEVLRAEQQSESEIVFHIRLIDSGNEYTQTLRGMKTESGDRFEYVTE